MRIALAQINPIVGDLPGNSKKIVAYAHQAHARGADLVVFPELCVVGYPPMDLLDNPAFMDATEKSVQWISTSVPRDMGVIIGAPVRNPHPVGKRLFNAALVLEGGRCVGSAYKTLLPTYDVFDEYRYFEPAPERRPVLWRGLRLGLHVCEDMWNNQEEALFHLYGHNPIDELAEQGIDLFVNISASPFAVGKHGVRTVLIEESCREHHTPFVCVNQVGTNTELIFDGDSRVFTADGSQVMVMPMFEEALDVWDTERALPPIRAEHDDLADIHEALLCGIRDYFHKTGFFNKALLGLSGGIDSAVTCALAVEALGPEYVVGVTMPSRYSSSGSVDDSIVLAEALGIEIHTLPIVPAVEAFDEILKPMFAGTKPGVAEENIQARARGVTLMALSNKFNYLLLTTGNKSEMAVGYATLYGDMSGGLAVLADVFKMDVYALAERINARAGRDVIPRSTIEKAPSAELRPDQKDEDSLPPYPVLDMILRHYIEDHLDLEAIAARTQYDPALITDILRKVDQNEYKRRQAAPGLRVTDKAFGIGRRLPIVMRWKRTLPTSEPA